MEKQSARMEIIEQAMGAGVPLKEIFRGLLKEYAKLEYKIEWLELSIRGMENDTACIPEHLSVTEYVSQLRAIRSGLREEMGKLHDFQHNDPHKRVSAESWGKNIVDWIIDYATRLEADQKELIGYVAFLEGYCKKRMSPQKARERFMLPNNIKELLGEQD